MAGRMTVGQMKKQKGEADQLLHLRKKVEQLESEKEKLHAKLGEQKEFVREIKSAVIAADPFPVARFRHTEPRSNVTATLLLSDWHIGEVIAKDETEGFGQYNYAVAQERLFYIVGAFLDWTRVQRNAYGITDCAVFGIGDYISGDIHRELSVTNEFPVPVQTAKAGLLLGESLRRLAGTFKSVVAYEVGADNHGRLTKKPQFKQRAENNMSHLVHIIANAHVERCHNIYPVLAKGIKYLASVSSKRFLIEHGSDVKAWMGIPYYGLERLQGREARRRMGRDNGFDYQAIGHWHVPGVVSRNIIINGSLCGTSEFDHAAGRYAPPSQFAFLVHPKHGVFNYLAFETNGKAR